MKQAFWVRHSAFKPYKVSFPIHWRQIDPYKNKNWLHHFNSLRWLLNETNDELVKEILMSFYNYHCVKKVNNPYYFDLRGDHTGAIRLGILCTLKDRFEAVEEKSIPSIGICNRLILEEIKNLQRPQIYRKGHNHGLMLDIALLKIVQERRDQAKYVDLENIVERSANTVDMMWFESGLTKEHSISYQEYNLPITIEYFELLERLDIAPTSAVRLSNIIEESKKILGFALKSNGEYFPLGDSFREPKPAILETVYAKASKKEANAHELLSPYSTEEGCYGNDHFFFYRKTINGKKVHFAATCCWDSHSHKQNDELSFCLEVDGISLFDDPGYSEFLSGEMGLFLASEQSHTTIQVSGVEWSNKMMCNDKSRVNSYKEGLEGFHLKMQCERVEGVLFTREIELNSDGVRIKDVISGVLPQSAEVIRRFICGEGIQVNKLKTDYFTLTYGNQYIANLQFYSSQFFNDEINHNEQVDLVLRDRRYVSSVNVLEHKVKPSNAQQVIESLVAIMELKF